MTELLEKRLAELPIYAYFFIKPSELEFSERVRHICRTECPMYGKSWACPPGVGTVAQCRERCLAYENCLVIGSAAEVPDASDMHAALDTRPAHEALTDQVRDILRELGQAPYVLSSEACAICARCAFPDGLPCRLPGKMHPCVESHGINLIPALEADGLPFLYSSTVITWYSLLFFGKK